MSDQCMLQCIYTSVPKAPNSTWGDNTWLAWLAHVVQCMLMINDKQNILLQSLTYSSTILVSVWSWSDQCVCRTIPRTWRYEYAAGLYTSAGEWLTSAWYPPPSLRQTMIQVHHHTNHTHLHPVVSNPGSKCSDEWRQASVSQEIVAESISNLRPCMVRPLRLQTALDSAQERE